jgi:hypothetical protein
VVSVCFSSADLQELSKRFGEPPLTAWSLHFLATAFLPYHLHAHIAFAAHADCSCRTAAQIDRPALYEWTAVIDANDYRAAIARVCNANPRSERQRPVGSGQAAGIELLAGGCSSSGKLSPIVTGNLSPSSTFQAENRTYR